MATAARVLKTALQRILVQGAEVDLQPDEYQDAIFAMNNLVLAWDAEGIQLGYTEVTDLGDDVTVPIGALRGLIANLAIEIAPDYNGTISAGLIKAADRGMNAIRQLGQSVPTSVYPSTLPIGSGNEGNETGGRYPHYYPDLEEQILAETTGAISLEVGTATATGGSVPAPTPTPGEFTYLDADDTAFVAPLTVLDADDTSYLILDTFQDADDTPYAL